MTVNTINITSGPYTGNGLSDEYEYTFRVTNKTQLSVYETTDLGVRTLLVVDTDYTVNNVGVDAGGTITRLAGNLPTDYTWYIRSNYVENQLTDFSSQGGFFPDVHEDQMDHLTFLIQQHLDKINRSFRLDDSIDIDGDFTIAQNAAARANKHLSFDSNGDLLLSEGIPSVPVSAFMATVLDDATANEATTTLKSLFTHDNKAAAVLVEPVNGKIEFIGGTDGGFFKGVTGAAPGTYSDNGGSYCGTQFIPTGGDGSAARVRDIQDSFDAAAFGAQAGVASDQYTALNNAITAAVAANKKLTISPNGDGDKDYQINTGIVFAADDLKVEFVGGAYLKPVNNTLLTPLTIGGTSQPTRMLITAPRVDRTTYSGATENEGIVILETTASTIINPESRHSKYNYVFRPTVGGCAHNTFINPVAINGFYNFWMKEMGSGGETGYVNENDFIGGRAFTAGNTDTNFRCEGGTNPYGTGHNRISMSLEGTGVQAIYDDGASNQWIQCRTEGTWSAGAGHVYGTNCQYPMIISSRYDYDIDKSAATDPRDQVIGYQGSKLSSAINGITTLEIENQSASAGSGMDIYSNLDVDTAFAWRVMRLSDSLVRAQCTADGKLQVAKQFYNEQSGYNFEPLRLGSDWFWIDGNYFRHHGSAPSAATDGRILAENQTSVAAGLGNIANTVNTIDKYTGKEVFDTGLNRPVWATGSTAGAVWVYSDGTTAYTPV